jgi:hypothetical protein
MNLKNISIETNMNGSYTMRANVKGKPLKMTYYFYTKVHAINRFLKLCKQKRG